MQRYVLAALILATFPAAAAAWQGKISGGTGFEGRASREVNPQLVEGQWLPHFFAQYRLWPYAVSVEGGWENRDTSSGALKVEARTLELGAWGRYEFLPPLHWTPFASLGVGCAFDSVTSKYESESDSRSGRRLFAGAGLGVTHVVWRHVLVEAEFRASAIQDRRDPSYSAIFRVGAVL